MSLTTRTPLGVYAVTVPRYRHEPPTNSSSTTLSSDSKSLDSPTAIVVGLLTGKGTPPSAGTVNGTSPVFVRRIVYFTLNTRRPSVNGGRSSNFAVTELFSEGCSSATDEAGAPAAGEDCGIAAEAEVLSSAAVFAKGALAASAAWAAGAAQPSRPTVRTSEAATSSGPLLDRRGPRG
ncbi:hypothetical protein [Rathayibacter festucae]|uniref:hypothetical protein n=1 Tax=Rathayibacter festucae TaxID=110937 RepID=UPI002A6A9356|nr:hypothetical protein [Rathayibacter festucae]MDY0913012.1 hypothetical protein [Rathayibacter festucae]